MWDQVKNIVGQAAPMVGTLLGGPSGGVIGSLISSVLGVQDSPEAILKELMENPEALLKIVEFQSNNAKRLQELALDQYAKQMEDTQQAREEHADHWMPSFLTLILCAMVTGMFCTLMWATIPKSYEQLIMMIAGQVMGAFSTAIVYWLGATMMNGFKRRKLNKVTSK